MKALPGTHKSHNVGWPEDSNLGGLGWAWESIYLHTYVCMRVSPHARSAVSDSLQPHGLQSARLLCPWHILSRNTGVGCHFLRPGDLPDPGTEPVCPALAGGFFNAEPSGKPC